MKQQRIYTSVMFVPSSSTEALEVKAALRRVHHRLVIVLLCMTSLMPLRAQRATLVDPFLGSEGGGNVFPGACVPFGILKAGPDVTPNTGNAGWLPTGPIEGFSQTHVSGTGGGAKYGNILVQPTTGPVLPLDHGSERAAEKASAGMYGVTLTRYGLQVQIAPARRTALYQFQFPKSSESNLLIDAGHLLSAFQKQHEGQNLLSSTVTVVSPTEISGSTEVSGGWNKQPVGYTVYFYGVSDTPATSSGTWLDGAMHPGSNADRGDNGHGTGAWLSFPTHARQSVSLKVGISFLSVAQARDNAVHEIEGFDFAKAHAAALQQWEKALSPVDVEGASEDDQRQFFTALYHTMLMPTDRTGENPLFQSSEPAYDDFYAIWDTFRTSSPLLILIAEDRQSKIVRSLVDLYRHQGWLPDARTGNYNGRVQGGSDADMTIVDGYLKHLPGVDWQAAYEAVRNDAERNSDHPLEQGRGDLDEWKTLGYLSIEGSDRPASKSMEYAANDYAVALLARGLGKEDDYRKYMARAGNWRNLWDKGAEDGGFQGFIWSRHRDGSWKPDFNGLSGGTWGSDTFYEGNAWTYSTYVPQDVAGLIEASGGRETFVRRMDAFFEVPQRYDVGNEPGFLSPYLYLWAGRPDRTQQQVRAILARSYNSSRKGLPGNDDSGAMSSWYLFNKIGIYPNAAQDVYLIGTPAYPAVAMHLANGQTFRIESENNGTDRPYVAAATWNGKPYTRAWMTHEQIMEGGTLHLKMSNAPTTWGTTEPPPSITK